MSSLKIKELLFPENRQSVTLFFPKMILNKLYCLKLKLFKIFSQGNRSFVS